MDKNLDMIISCVKCGRLTEMQEILAMRIPPNCRRGPRKLVRNNIQRSTDGDLAQCLSIY